MNCEEFRHQLLTDPYVDDASFLEHARVCLECARAAKKALVFEQSLRAALTAELASTAWGGQGGRTRRDRRLLFVVR